MQFRALKNKMIEWGNVKREKVTKLWYPQTDRQSKVTKVSEKAIEGGKENMK